MSTNHNDTLIELLAGMLQDAVLWKAKRLWSHATDPDEQAVAMDELMKMVTCIGNETKRLQYIELVQKELKIKNQLLKKQVRDFFQAQEAKKQAAIAKAKIENQFKNTEDAGLPDGFKGEIYDALKYGIYEHEGVYYTRGTKGGDYPVTNFTMKIIYQFDTGDELAFRLITVKNVYGFESYININTDDFVSLGPFKKILARRGDYIFKGTDSDLSRLQELLQKDEVKAKYVKTLGWNKRAKFYGFANGIFPINKDFIPVDEYGIIEHDGKKYFIPAVSKMYIEKDDQFVNEKKFIYRKPVDGFGFKEWSKLFYDTYGDKSIPGILFYIGSLYRDIIMKQLQRYPMLCLFGPPGAGKGQMAESLMCMFGEKQDQIMLGGASTVVGFMRKFAQFSNAIVWLDEYKNNLPMKFIESFKNIYDGKGYERGKMTNDFATESTPIHSSCILSGQDMPTIEPALFMRTILLSFEDGKFTDEQRKSFQQLKDLEAPGLSYITTHLLQYRDIIESDFKERQQIIFKQLIREVANVEVDDRMILNISMLLTFQDLLLHKLDLPFTFKESKAFLIENMMHQHTILAGNNDIAKFWGVVESLFHQEILFEGKDFELADGYIYLCLSKAHPQYIKEMRMRGDMNYLSKSTMEHYLQLDKTVFVEHKKRRFADGSNNWVYQMKYNRIGIDLIKIQKKEYENAEQHNIQLEMKMKEMDNPKPIVGGKVESAPFDGWRPVEEN